MNFYVKMNEPTKSSVNICGRDIPAPNLIFCVNICPAAAANLANSIWHVESQKSAIFIDSPHHG
jgi:hypothetical protein